GVKFNDAELIGIPLRLTVGPRGLADGVVEFNDRATGESSTIPLDAVVDTIAERIGAARS
ncbi:MAG: proline--tRNA ligase, partial [Acidimicrobiia bacterium]|nr:proline--tRNA ligase [Acidimicrobiia bacterium]